jgi:uncharacterized protein YecE (DUF72 family)
MIYCGTAGFSYKDWEGIVYPKGLKKSTHPLGYLARFFDCCEINTSFYGHIAPKTGKQWCEFVAEVNPRFLFTAKLHKSLTHAPVANVQPTSAETIVHSPEDEKLCREGLDSLGAAGKLGAVLAQFPVSFKKTAANLDYVRSLIGRFGGYPLVIEIRHDSWNEPALLAELAAQGVGFCNIDQPKLGRSLRPTEHATSPVGYVRLHGRNYKQWFDSDNRNDRYNYLYTRKELEGWTERIKTVAQTTEKTFAITNNHYKGKAAANALEIKHLLSGKKVEAPETLVQEYPALGDIVDHSP